MMLMHVGKRLLGAALFGSVLFPVISGTVSGAAGLTSHLRQVAPLRQDTVRVPSAADFPKEAAPASVASAAAPMPGAMETAPGAYMPPVGGYDPAGRRDPFAPLLSQLAPGQVDSTLPPLQRVSLTDMNLIAVIWGAYGYTAMVQTPDGNGYSVRKGTRVGPNSGVVSAVTEKGIIVQERFTDVYGRKQEREYVKLLHPKEGLE
ncbi:MAG TPA: pilus assembly protein PilP [Nitrospira sp.]|nr:pilus assembly protein PilP [Nitrospira sp.]